MLLNILLAAVIVVCVALIGVILLQRSEGGVMGMGGGPGNFMTARGTGDLLTRTTMVLAAIFFSLCLVMTLITGHIHRQESLASKLKDLAINPVAPSSQPASQSAAAQQIPTLPQRVAPAPAPLGPSPSGLNLFGNGPAPRAAPPVAAPMPVPTPVPAAPIAKPAAAAKPPAAAKPATPAKPATARPQAAKPAEAAPPLLTLPPPPAATPAPAAPAPAPAAPANP